jgi:uncharacterized membrane protein
MRAGLLLSAGPHSANFDLLLIVHVATALLSFGAVVTSGVQAARLRRSGGAGAGLGVRRYFAPGINWAGRVLYGVPLSGFALLGASAGQFGPGEGWVVTGLVIWGLSALLAELILWPAERRIQGLLADAIDAEPDRARPGLRRECRAVSAAAGALGVAFIAAIVLMVARPG